MRITCIAAAILLTAPGACGGKAAPPVESVGAREALAAKARPRPDAQKPPAPAPRKSEPLASVDASGALRVRAETFPPAKNADDPAWSRPEHALRTQLARIGKPKAPIVGVAGETKLLAAGLALQRLQVAGVTEVEVPGLEGLTLVLNAGEGPALTAALDGSTVTVHGSGIDAPTEPTQVPPVRGEVDWAGARKAVDAARERAGMASVKLLLVGGDEAIPFGAVKAAARSLLGAPNSWSRSFALSVSSTGGPSPAHQLKTQGTAEALAKLLDLYVSSEASEDERTQAMFYAQELAENPAIREAPGPSVEGWKKVLARPGAEDRFIAAAELARAATGDRAAVVELLLTRLGDSEVAWAEEETSWERSMIDVCLDLAGPAKDPVPEAILAGLKAGLANPTSIRTRTAALLCLTAVGTEESKAALGLGLVTGGTSGDSLTDIMEEATSFGALTMRARQAVALVITARQRYAAGKLDAEELDVRRNTVLRELGGSEPLGRSGFGKK